MWGCPTYEHAGRVIFIRVLFFESYLEIKENIISTGLIFGGIRVGLRTKDRNPTLQSYPESYTPFLVRLPHGPMVTIIVLPIPPHCQKLPIAKGGGHLLQPLHMGKANKFMACWVGQERCTPVTIAASGFPQKHVHMFLLVSTCLRMNHIKQQTHHGEDNKEIFLLASVIVHFSAEKNHRQQRIVRDERSYRWDQAHTLQ